MHSRIPQHLADLHKYSTQRKNKKVIKVGEDTRNFVVLSAPSTLKKSPKSKQLNKDLYEVTSDASRKSKQTARKLFKVSPTPL